MDGVSIKRKSNEQFFRRKFPKLITKLEGKGNGIKTVIVNMPEIAKSLNRPPMYPTKYFGCLLGTQVNFDNKSERYIVNGAHDPNKLQDLLDGFKQKYVLCQSCENPETILSVNDSEAVVIINCEACGHRTTISTENDRVATFILKNPPTQSDSVRAALRVNTDSKKELNVDWTQDGARNMKRARFEHEESSGSENYEDLDYGDDDDDDDDGDVELQSDTHDDNKEENEDSQQQQEDQEQPADATELAERCKFWPSCNAGSDCAYYHPSKPCRAFPKCRFGRKCMYVHPPCKYNPNCTKPFCPFAHPATVAATGRQGPSYHEPVAPKCRYGPNCKNPMCQFTHQRPEPCKFGSNCLLETCSFTHPSNLSRPKPVSAFKWSAES